MNEEQFAKLITTLEDLTTAIRNLDRGTGDKRRVANAQVERDLFEMRQIDEDFYPVGIPNSPSLDNLDI